MEKPKKGLITSAASFPLGSRPSSAFAPVLFRAASSLCSRFSEGEVLLFEVLSARVVRFRMFHGEYVCVDE